MVGRRGSCPKLIWRGGIRSSTETGRILLRWLERNPVDFGTQDWYTRRPRACKKCLILLGFCERCGNPSLRSELSQTLILAEAYAIHTLPRLSKRRQWYTGHHGLRELWTLT